MNTLRELADTVASGHLPTGVLVGAGIVLLLIAMKAARALLKWALVVLALAALAGAGWWHFHQHG